METSVGSIQVSQLKECMDRLSGTGTSSAVREEVAEKICAQFNERIFSPEETKIVAEILSLLSQDLEIKVRKIISHSLKENSNLPHDIALRLAKDISEVSLPLLEFSFVLTDDDLIDIIRSTKEAACLLAVSRRKSLSYRLVDELVNSKDKQIIKNLISNKDAYLSPRSTQIILDQFKNSEDVMGILVDRGNLPLSLVEKMVTMVSNKLKDQLYNQYNIAPDLASLMAEDARDEIILSAAQSKKIDDINNLVKYLYDQRKLNFSIVLRALCKGELEFFETGMGYLTNIPRSNVHKLIHDPSFKGFIALYKSANLPENLFEATKIILRFAITENTHGLTPDYSARLIKMIVTNGFDHSVPQMKFLMTLINPASGLRGNEDTLH